MRRIWPQILARDVATFYCKRILIESLETNDEITRRHRGMPKHARRDEREV